MKLDECPRGRPMDDPDRFYQALVDAHEGLDAEQSQRLNARLILLLAQYLHSDEQAHALLQRGQPGNRCQSACRQRGLREHEGVAKA